MPKKKRAAARPPTEAGTGTWLKDHAGWILTGVGLLLGAVIAFPAWRDTVLGQRVRLHCAITVEVATTQAGELPRTMLRAVVVNTGRQPIVLKNLARFLVVDPNAPDSDALTYIGAFGNGAINGAPVVLQPGAVQEATAAAGAASAMVGPSKHYGVVFEDQDGEWLHLPSLPGAIGVAGAEALLSPKAWETRRLNLASGELVVAPRKGTAVMPLPPKGA